MNIFISWSGERSRQIAEYLKDWLKWVIQAANPFVSSKDIDRGKLWFAAVNSQLANTGVGILCLTNENKNAPWILFEAGALAKGAPGATVIPLLIDLEIKDVTDPLAQFNLALPNEDGVWKIVLTVNNALGDKGLPVEILTKTFKTYWHELDEKIREIIEEIPAETIKEKRSESDVVSEILETVRALEKRTRNFSDIGKKEIEIDLRKLYNGAIFSSLNENENLESFLNHSNMLPQEYKDFIRINVRASPDGKVTTTFSKPISRIELDKVIAFYRGFGWECTHKSKV